MFPIQTDARIQILAGVSLLHSSRPVGGQEGLAGYGRRYTGTKPETVDTRQADALRSRPVLSYSETGRSLVRIQSPRPLSSGLCRRPRVCSEPKSTLTQHLACGSSACGALAASRGGLNRLRGDCGWGRIEAGGPSLPLV